MESVSDIVALLRRQTELEGQLLNNRNATLAAERELEATRRRLSAHPGAVNAILQTARALGRTPDAVSAQQVEAWSGTS
jgi:hypothetical protein